MPPADFINDDIFQGIQQTLDGLELGIVDALQFVAGFCATKPQVAYAFSTHLADTILDLERAHGEDVAVTWSYLIGEAYRRTFFDPEKAPLYGTGGACRNRAALQQLASMITSSFASAAQTGAENLAPSTATSH